MCGNRGIWEISVNFSQFCKAKTPCKDKGKKEERKEGKKKEEKKVRKNYCRIIDGDVIMI